LLVALAVAAGVALPWQLPSARAVPDVAPGTTRIMVVGDSISQGFGGDWTWRYWVWRELRRQHVDADFVGPLRLPYKGTRYERPSPWDDQHAARSGSMVDDHLPVIAQEVAQFAPTVLVVELGINDVIHGDDAPTVARQLQDLITRAQLVAPTMRVVLAEIVSTTNAHIDPVTQDVNERMARWAPWHRVVIAHLRTGEGDGAPRWNPVRDAFDGVHPNAIGQTLLAQRIGEALVQLGVLAEPFTTFARRTWAPDLRPTAQPGPGGVAVDWSAAAREVDLSAVRVHVDGKPASGWISVSRATRVFLPLPPGQHGVQLVGRRRTMIGSPGDAVRVWVPRTSG
jgi:hypothetical protein